MNLGFYLIPMIFLIITALIILRLTHLYAAVMLTGIYSLLCGLVFIEMEAVDVAFTEAAVGAGISTLLMLATLVLTGTEKQKHSSLALRPWPLLIVGITGAALIWGTQDMPFFADPNAPAHQHVAPRYIHESGKEVGPPNMVTSVLASYRGYDTLGEVTVIFTAGIAVIALLGRRRRSDENARQDWSKPQSQIIPQPNKAAPASESGKHD